VLLFFGTVIAFLPDRAYALAAAAAKSDKTAATIAILLLVFTVGVARAEPPNSGNFARNDHDRSVFQKLKCLCGTCLHSLDECGGRDDCGSGVMRRGEVQRMIDQGMSDQSILDAEVAKYGAETLRMPVDKGINRLAWILPYGAFLAAAGVLVMFARRWSLKKKPATPDAKPPADEDAEYADKLADELDKLD
jgi:cytochrome c-type biogenesis protein CcmH/NrfF